jgi:DNA-binding response OmpR family regulator
MPPAKILVVDDEQEIVRALTMRLRAAGYQVISAHDGLVGTQMAITESPDLVILDIGMPCGDGHTVAQRLMNNKETRATPIIFLTARTSEIDRKKAKNVHAAGYLTKPFKSQDLLDTIADALSLGCNRSESAYTSLMPSF